MQRHALNRNDAQEPVTKKQKSDLEPESILDEDTDIDEEEKPRKKAKTEEQPFDFCKLPPDLQRHITTFLTLEEFPTIARVSKHFYRLAHGPHFWQQNFQRYLPNELPKISRKWDIDRDKQFVFAKRGSTRPASQKSFAQAFHHRKTKRYAGLSLAISKVFQLVIEGNNQAIDMSTITIEDLSHYDKSGTSLCCLAVRAHNQELLNAFYQIAIKYYQIDDQPHEIDLQDTDTHDQTILHWAIKCRQPLEYIATLITSGCDIHARGEEGRTPLMYAALSNYPECIKLLLDKGADLNQVDDEGLTALHLCVAARNTAAASMLLACGAIVDSHAYGGGVTPLQEAARKGNHEYLRLLLEKGANVHYAHDSNSKTALMYAAVGGNVECVRLLLDARANLESRSTQGNTALGYAIIKGYHECAALMLNRGADLHQAANNFGITLLTLAAKNGRTKCLRLLLDRGITVNQTSASFHTPDMGALIQAGLNGHLDCLNLLLAAGANIEYTDADGYTALFAAVENGHTECVNMLLDKHANPNCTAAYGASALMLAATEGHHSCLSLLLDSGADLELRKTDNGWTALFCAAFNMRLDCVKQLTERGADINYSIEISRKELYALGLGNGHRALGILAALRKIDGYPVRITAEDLSRVCGNVRVADYLKGVREERSYNDAIDMSRAFW
jgi:ankyrin repeat protein